MHADTLVFGIVGAPSGSVESKLRDLTRTWSRYDYRGRILEAETIEQVLEQALGCGYRWCLVQAAGHVILESWHADGSHARFSECISACIEEPDFLVMGEVVGDSEGGYGLDDQCLLVDVARYGELGRPAFGPAHGEPVERVEPAVHALESRFGDPPGRTRVFLSSGEVRSRTACVPGWSFVDASLRNGLPVHDLGPMFRDRRLSLGLLSSSEAPRFARYLGNGILGYRSEEAELDPGTAAFLEGVQMQVANATRGIFLWNLEPYDDVRTRPQGFEPPISTLYSVASGFKPNAILESLGFDELTRVVFFDYSAGALEAKRLLLEDWDGEDFPRFARYLFRRLPSEVAYYQLWCGATPETLDWSEMERAWTRELELWGGEQAFERHWSRYRRLRHEFVHCDVLSSAGRLLHRVEPERSAVIWWSNAFFTVYGNWLYTAGRRRRLYEQWIFGLAERNPDLFLYGSDFCNSSVNHVRAGDYRSLLRAAGDELVPLSANAREIRF